MLLTLCYDAESNARFTGPGRDSGIQQLKQSAVFGLHSQVLRVVFFIQSLFIYFTLNRSGSRDQKPGQSLPSYIS